MVDILWKGCVSADHFVMVFYMKYSCELYKTTGVSVSGMYQTTGIGERCHETPHRPHRPHRPQIQVLGIGKMCLVWCILYISIKKSNKLRFSCISDLHFVTLAAYSV